MKKNCLFLCLFLIGCISSNPSISKLNSLEPGISRANLVKYFGGRSPINTQVLDGHYVLKYEFSRADNPGGVYPFYFIFDQNDHLVGWEEVKGQGKVVAGGATILIPFPSR